MALVKKLITPYIESPILLLLLAALVGLIVMLILHIGGDYVQIGVRIVMLLNLLAFSRYLSAKRASPRVAPGDVGRLDYRNGMLVLVGVGVGVTIWTILFLVGWWDGR